MKKEKIRIITTISLILVFWMILFSLLIIIPPIFHIYCASFVLYEVYFDKIVDKFGFKKITILLILLYVVIIGYIAGGIIIRRIELIKEWNVIKEDYEIINVRAIDYANENLGGGTTHAVLSIETKAFSNLTIREKEALNNIKNYYSYQNEIRIYDDQIKYCDATGYLIIIYSRTGEKPKVENRRVVHLNGNWYQAY